ncbi:MAG: monovalent cation/H+ antiporter subunit D family protein [Alphaproteobacteria bacterium]|nr:monovalent cation/H+ antiporter subunit D family protein [Alphaproteobacteria bacterium]
MNPTDALIAALLIPVAGAALVALAGRWPNLRETITLVTAVVLFATVTRLVPGVIDGGRPAVMALDVAPGLDLAFRLEPLGMLFALIASFLWIINSIYSIGYMRANNEPRQTQFYVCFAVAIAATLGIAFSANLFTLFIFYEILTLTTYPLVAHHGDSEARAGGRTYLMILLGTSIVFFIPALLWTLSLAGTLDFVPGGVLGGVASPTVIVILLALFAFGIGKAALMPVHRWLPAAMVAPTPVSALLHAVAVVKAGVFTIVKVGVYTFGIDTLSAISGADWLLYLAGFTVIAASIIALRQDNLKRRLAYSTVSQLSYVILALAILTPISVAGAALHIAAHAFGKITLFFAAGSIYTAAHKTEISQLDGIGRVMPWTMGAFAIGALSMVGIPPTAGFVSKWFILTGAMDSQNLFAVAVIIVSTLLNAAYFMPIVYQAFFRKLPDDPGHSHGEAPFAIVLALSLTALGTVVLFFFHDTALTLARQLAGIS